MLQTLCDLNHDGAELARGLDRLVRPYAGLASVVISLAAEGPLCWMVQMIADSACTVSMPRIRNLRKLRACLIYPNTGFDSCLRSRQRLL